MSTDNHRPSVTGFRCEAVTSDATTPPCDHHGLASLARPEPAGLDRQPSHADDPAVLIGLALASVRQGPLLDGPVPKPLLARLAALVEHDNAACRLVVDWISNRNRRLGSLPDAHLTLSAPIAMSAKTEAVCRSLGERVLARAAKPGDLNERRRLRTRPRDAVQNPETAIIAAKGDRADG